MLEFCRQETHIARKVHKCSLCNGDILPKTNSKQVITALKECSKHKECAYCDLIYECSDKRELCKLVLKVIREYEDEIDRLKNKE